MSKMLDKIENFSFKIPGKEAIKVLLPYLSCRQHSLDELKVHDGICAWCNEDPVKKPRKKYCSDNCSESAFIFCYPQSPSAKSWILVNRQNFACCGCGLSFYEDFEKRLKHYIETYPQFWAKKQKLTLHYFSFNKGWKWQADHIKPIFLGGQGLGLDNIQVLCTDCHKRKTKTELQAPAL
jgi:5-methylcytosine-specific restriction endonuclease McrA